MSKMHNEEVLMMKEDSNYTEALFEAIRHVNEYEQEFWYARELQVALEYKRWDKFLNIVEKAKKACEGSGQVILDHFFQVGKMVSIGFGVKREVKDYVLSRYTCYLIVMNGDSTKKVIALGQTYFAVKTRQQELIEDYEQLSEDQKRLAIREEMRKHNKLLVAAAREAGVQTALAWTIG